MSKRHLKGKLLGSTMRLMQLREEESRLFNTMIKTIRLRIMFDLPMDGAIGVRRKSIPRGYSQVEQGVVEVYSGDKVLATADLWLYDRFEDALSKVKSEEEFGTVYRRLTGDYLSGRMFTARGTR